MSGTIAALIDPYRQPLLYGYVGALVAAGAAFALSVWRWSVLRERNPGTGQRLDGRAGLPPAVAVSAGLLWLLMILPFFVDHLGRMGAIWREDPPLVVFMTLFAAIGLFLLGIGLRGLGRGGAARDMLELGEVVLRPGGLVSGRYRIARARGDGGPVRVHLVLQQTRFLRWRRNRHLMETALWSDSQAVRPRQRGEGVEIPFLFRLPPRLPALAEDAGRPEWVLVREGGGLGGDIHMVRAGAAGVSAWRGRREAGPPRPAAPLAPASALAWRGRGGRLAEFVALGFVMAFPWLFWFLWDAQRQPWLHLREQLPPVLLAGALFLIPFLTAVLALLGWATAGSAEGRRWRRALRLALAGDAVIVGGLALWLGRHGLPSLGGDRIDAVMDFVTVAIPRGILGGFLWISLIVPFAALRHHRRQRQRPQGAQWPHISQR